VSRQPRLVFTHAMSAGSVPPSQCRESRYNRQPERGLRPFGRPYVRLEPRSCPSGTACVAWRRPRTESDGRRTPGPASRANRHRKALLWAVPVNLKFYPPVYMEGPFRFGDCHGGLDPRRRLSRRAMSGFRVSCLVHCRQCRCRYCARRRPSVHSNIPVQAPLSCKHDVEERNSAWPT